MLYCFAWALSFFSSSASTFASRFKPYSKHRYLLLMLLWTLKSFCLPLSIARYIVGLDTLYCLCRSHILTPLLKYLSKISRRWTGVRRAPLESSHSPSFRNKWLFRGLRSNFLTGRAPFMDSHNVYTLSQKKRKCKQRC